MQTTKLDESDSQDIIVTQTMIKNRCFQSPIELDFIPRPPTCTPMPTYQAVLEAHPHTPTGQSPLS